MAVNVRPSIKIVKKYVKMNGLRFVWQTCKWFSIWEIYIWLVEQGHFSKKILINLMTYLTYNITSVQSQHSNFCHCGNPLLLLPVNLLFYGVTYCILTLTLIFPNTSYYTKVTNKLQHSIKTIVRTETHTRTHPHN